MQRRSKGTGSVTEKVKGNTYQLRYNGPPDSEGNRKAVSHNFHGTKGEAEKELRKRMEAIEQGNYVAKSREILSQFMGSWLDGYVSTHCTLRTLQGYRQKVNAYIIPYLGGIQLQGLTARHVQDFHKWMLGKGLSNQSVVHAHRVLSEALKHAVQWGVIPRNPAESVSPPRPQPTGIEVWDMTEIKRFLEAAKDSPFYEAFELALYTGLRRSEITGLKWECIDFNNNTLRVTATLQRISGQKLVVGQPKSKSGRRNVALGQTAVSSLRGIQGKQIALRAELGDLYQNPEGFIFTDELGNPLDADRLTKEFSRIVKRAGLPHASLHSLRHCHASLLLSEGVNIKAISERLGHSKVSLTLDVYSHLLPGLQESAADTLDRLLA